MNLQRKNSKLIVGGGLSSYCVSGTGKWGVFYGILYTFSSRQAGFTKVRGREGKLK